MPSGLIIKSLSGFYHVRTIEGNTYVCKPRGIFRKNEQSPIVGDIVDFQLLENQEGSITEIHPRKNTLIRPPIANVDLAVLVFSAVQPEWSPLLLDRFLVMIEYANIQPIIIVSKWDLLTLDEKKRVENESNYYKKIGYPVFYVSKDKVDRNALQEWMDNKVVVICGQSGVGKSSLLNLLESTLELKTDEISMHLGRGKHTTRHVELLHIQNGWIADTPGFSSLEFLEQNPLDLAEAFVEFRDLSTNCKFRGCLHHAEPGCAVKSSYENGGILSSRYQNYLSFLHEIKERKPRYE